MAIRDWPARRLLLAWAVGLSLEAAIFATAALSNRRAVAEAERRWQERHGPTSGARVPTPVERDSILRLLSERHGVTLHTRGNTLTGIQLSPAAESTAARLTSGLGAAVVMVAFVAALFYLPIPVGLVAITAIWLRARRRRAEGVAPAT